MSTRRWRMLAVAIAGAGVTCVGATPRPPHPSRSTDASAISDTTPSTEALEQARAAANALGKDLQGKLLAALDSGGPAHALAFCADSAQIVSARHAREGVYVRRVSLRTRNLADWPDAVEEEQLRYLDSLHRMRALPTELARTRRWPDGARVLEYVRPILVQERCLACHGDRERLAPAVREVLSSRYPADQAVGYRAGDLRGMISVRVRE